MSHNLVATLVGGPAAAGNEPESWQEVLKQLAGIGKASGPVVRIDAVWGIGGRVGPVRSDIIRVDPVR